MNLPPEIKTRVRLKARNELYGCYNRLNTLQAEVASHPSPELYETIFEEIRRIDRDIYFWRRVMERHE